MKDKSTPPSNKGNPVAKHMRTFNKATVQRDRKKDDKRGYSKHSNRYESADEFVPHDMFHPDTGETKRADSKATHLVLKARGWTHSKNESVEQVDEAKNPHPMGSTRVVNKKGHELHGKKVKVNRTATGLAKKGIHGVSLADNSSLVSHRMQSSELQKESVENAKSEKDSARMKLRHANQKVRLAKKQERENDRVSEDAGDPNSSAKKPVKFKKPDGTTGVKMVPAHQDVQTEACWDSHKQVGTKKKGGKTVPNCVPKESSKLDELSNDKVHNYLSKSMHQSDDAKTRGDSKLRAKREKGIKLGLKKQTGTAKVASTESYQQVLEASSNYLSKDDLPAKVKRVVTNIFKLAKSKKKKIVRLSVELVGKKYFVYVELGRDNNDEDFVGRIMDMETGREKFIEIHPSASVHPAPNVSIREAVQQVDESTRGGGVHGLNTWGPTRSSVMRIRKQNDADRSQARKEKEPELLDDAKDTINHYLKKSGGLPKTLSRYDSNFYQSAIQQIERISSKTAAKKEVAKGIKKYKGVKESVEQVEEAYFSVQFRDEKGKADSSSKNFKSASAAKKYADNANKTTKVGSYTTNKVQGRMESVEQVDEGVLNDIRDFIVAVGAAIPTKKNKRKAKDKALEDQIRMAMEADPEFDKIVRSVVFVRKDGVAAFKQGGRDKLDKYVFKTVDAKVAAKLGTLQKGYIRTMASGEKRNLGQNPRFNKGEKKAKEQGKIVYGDDMSSTQRQTTHAIGKIIKQVARRAYDDAKKEQKNESFRQVEEGRKLVLNINPKWSMKEVNREIKDTTQEIKQGQADHKRRPMNPTQADQHWQRKHYLEKLVALRKKKKSLGEDTMTDSISGNWGKVNEALSDVVVKKMQDMVGGPKNIPRGPEFRALKAKAQAAVAAEKKAKKAAPKAKTTTKTAKGKTHKGSADASDRNIIMQLRIAQDSMNHGDKTGDVLVSPTRTVALSKGKIDALLKKHDAIQKPVDKRKFVVLMTKALRGMK